jgi:hypothetical protein
MPRVASRNLSQPGDEDLRGLDQSGSCSHADRDTAANIGISGSAIPEREELTQAFERICGAAQALLGEPMWARGYWVATSGNVTDEVRKRYIEEQKPPEPDDDFNVV